MNILIISMIIIILVDIIITTIKFKFLINLILESFEIEKEIDDLIEEHICDIYRIMNFNGLVRPPENNKEEEEK